MPGHYLTLKSLFMIQTGTKNGPEHKLPVSKCIKIISGTRLAHNGIQVY